MHDAVSRFNALTSSVGISLAVIIAFATLTHLYLTKEPLIDLKINKIYDVVPNRNRRMIEYMEIPPDYHAKYLEFGLKADLRPIWTWGTHEIFLQVFAKYKTIHGVKRECIIWDKIITSKGSAKIDLNNVRAKYSINGPKEELDNLKADIHIRYEVVPFGGFIKLNEYDSTTSLVESKS